MTELWKIILTSAVTIFGGVTIYAIGRWIERFWIDPIVRFEEAKGLVIKALMLQANYRVGRTVWDSRELVGIGDELKTSANNLASSFQATFDVPKWIAHSRRLSRERVNSAILGLLKLSNYGLNSDDKTYEKVREQILSDLKLK